jgi:hypothetical protein
VKYLSVTRRRISVRERLQDRAISSRLRRFRVSFIAAARGLALLADSSGTTLSYELWSDQRGALSGFVRHMSGAD